MRFLVCPIADPDPQDPERIESPQLHPPVADFATAVSAYNYADRMGSAFDRGLAVVDVADRSVDFGDEIHFYDELPDHCDPEGPIVCYETESGMLVGFISERAEERYLRAAERGEMVPLRDWTRNVVWSRRRRADLAEEGMLMS